MSENNNRWPIHQSCQVNDAGVVNLAGRVSAPAFVQLVIGELKPSMQNPVHNDTVKISTMIVNYEHYILMPPTSLELPDRLLEEQCWIGWLVFHITKQLRLGAMPQGRTANKFAPEGSLKHSKISAHCPTA